MKLLSSVMLKGILLAYMLSIFPAFASDADRDVNDALDATDNRSCAKAFKLLDRAIKKAPNDYQVYMTTGAIYVRCGKLSQSMKFYTKAIALAKQMPVQNQYTKSDIAVAYRAIGNYANAVSYGKEAEKLSAKAGDAALAERMDILISDIEDRKTVGQL